VKVECGEVGGDGCAGCEEGWIEVEGDSGASGGGWGEFACGTDRVAMVQVLVQAVVVLPDLDDRVFGEYRRRAELPPGTAEDAALVTVAETA
jgi:hypothetical protein